MARSAAATTCSVASIVALDLKTGQRKWHYQEVHHDLWDYDGPASPVLADVTYQGKPRKILMHGSKTGMMYILDRTNGQPLIGIEEKPVTQQPEQKTSKTQPFPIGDRSCRCARKAFLTGIRRAACSRRSGTSASRSRLARTAASRGRR